MCPTQTTLAVLFYKIFQYIHLYFSFIFLFVFIFVLFLLCLIYFYLLSIYFIYIPNLPPSPALLHSNENSDPYALATLVALWL